MYEGFWRIFNDFVLAKMELPLLVGEWDSDGEDTTEEGVIGDKPFVDSCELLSAGGWEMDEVGWIEFEEVDIDVVDAPVVVYELEFPREALNM